MNSCRRMLAPKATIYDLCGLHHFMFSIVPASLVHMWCHDNFVQLSLLVTVLAVQLTLPFATRKLFQAISFLMSTWVYVNGWIKLPAETRIEYDSASSSSTKRSLEDPPVEANRSTAADDSQEGQRTASGWWNYERRAGEARLRMSPRTRPRNNRNKNIRRWTTKRYAG